MLSAVLAPLAAPALGLSLVRGPYLEGVTKHSAYVCLRTDEPAEATLELSAPKGRPRLFADREPRTQRCLEATGLEPGLRYRYRVGYGPAGRAAVWSSTYSLRAAAPGSEPATFAVLGDTGRRTREQFEVADRLREAKPDFVLLCGDVVYPYGEDRDYGPRYFAPYGAMLAETPVYIAIGNHDYGQESRSWAGARRRLGEFLAIHRLPRLQAGRPGIAAERGATYYSFDWGPGHFVAVDTNQVNPIAGAPEITPGSAQWRWLERDLAETRQPWKLVFLHHAAYSSGGHGSNEDLIRWLAPLFERRGVDVVFQGHDHHYERTTPIRGGRPAGAGPVYVVAGNGGAPLTTKNSRNPWSRVFVQEHGFLEVRLEGTRLRARAISRASRVLDAWELKKPKR